MGIGSYIPLFIMHHTQRRIRKQGKHLKGAIRGTKEALYASESCAYHRS